MGQRLGAAVPQWDAQRDRQQWSSAPQGIAALHPGAAAGMLGSRDTPKQLQKHLAEVGFMFSSLPAPASRGGSGAELDLSPGLQPPQLQGAIEARGCLQQNTEWCFLWRKKGPCCRGSCVEFCKSFFHSLK